MSILIKLQGLPLEATSVDVRRYFLGLTIPDGGVHIVGGDDGTVFIEFASDEDARQAMARGDGTIKNSSIRLLLSSRTEMQSVVEAARLKQQQHLQQLQQQQQLQNQQNQQQLQLQQPYLQPQQPYLNVWLSPMGPALLPNNHQHTTMLPAPNHHHQQQQQHTNALLPHNQQQVPPQPQQQQPALLHLNQQPTAPAPFEGDPRMLSQNYQAMLNVINQPQLGPGLPTLTGLPVLPDNQQQQQVQVHLQQQPQQQQLVQQQVQLQQQQQPLDQRARMSGMRGGDDKLFANKRCVLAASNIPYRATATDIIEFLSEFNIKEDCIRRRYNQKGQPTADAKIAFPTPEAAMKAMKMMNKKTLCGRPVFLKPV